jgi:hypothetical protein
MKAVDRAKERLDDGETAKAAAQLAAARRALASAQKAAVRRLAQPNGPASAGVLLRAHGEIAGDLAGLFDDQQGDAVDALAQTLAFTGDQRDALVAAIAALEDSAEAPYARLLGAAAGAIEEEIAGYDDTLADDTLTDPAKAAITAAKARAAATKSAMAARAGALGTAAPSGADAPEGEDRPCPRGAGPRGDRGSRDAGAEPDDERAPWL